MCISPLLKSLFPPWHKPTLPAYSDGKKTKHVDSFFSQSKLKSAYQEFLFTFFMYVSFTYCEAALKKTQQLGKPLFSFFLS